MKSLHRMRPQRGFTLIEIMVAVIVMCAGLLGVAKMQALALASTNVANVRSIVAIEAASLAATMHENRAYWAVLEPTANTNGTITVTSTGPTATPKITATDPAFATTQDCTSGGGTKAAPYCSTSTNAPAYDKVAAYDLQQWASAVNRVMPNYTATIVCNNLTPVSCTIQVTWTERAVALNSQEVSTTGSSSSYLQAPTFTLFVEP
jgi:type IV pilus assembly protein PilV